MKQTPLVSIIIPTYNRAHLIGETLDSVLAQTYKNWECIVVDDGSTDGTAELLASYCTKDSRFQYHHRPLDRPKGANACRNYGFELSKGDYVNWLDDDDLFSNNKLEIQIEVLVLNNSDTATCRWGRFKNGQDDLIIKENLEFYKNFKESLDLFKSFSKINSYFPSHSYLVKKAIIKKSGLWNETLLINQDGEFFCRVLINSNKITFAPDCYVGYRFTNYENTSSFNSKEKYISAFKSWRLIDSHIFNKYGLRNITYVRTAKNNLFKKVNKDYPELIPLFLDSQNTNNYLKNLFLKFFYKF